MSDSDFSSLCDSLARAENTYRANPTAKNLNAVLGAAQAVRGAGGTVWPLGDSERPNGEHVSPAAPRRR
jgi:hypothetical protein